MLARRFSILLVLLFSFATPTAHAHPGHDDDHDHEHAEAAPRAIMTTRPSAKMLPLAKEEDVFHFVIYGDRTGGVPEGLKVLEQAVKDTNLLAPDLVMTVGDLIQGYNEAPEWLREMKEYKEIMDRLDMKWYPVAGNHDVYWRGEGKPPQGHHEKNYEQHFGPLWYSFRHKNAGFVVLYSDEGDPATNRKAFNEPSLQKMSDEQLAFLDKALNELKDADHVFLFLHHPRWLGRGYGGTWDVVHKRLKEAGNVTAVFAGHIHQMRYLPKDGIEYYALATTGGHLSAEIPDAGFLHHLNIVTVRKDKVSVAALPVGAVFDPKQFTPEFLAEVGKAREIRPLQSTDDLVLNSDGSVRGEVSFTVKNSAPRAVDATVQFLPPAGAGRWFATLEHEHLRLAPGESAAFPFKVLRVAGDLEETSLPTVRLNLEYLGETARVRLPAVDTPIGVQPGEADRDYFLAQANRCLQVDREAGAVRVAAADIQLPDGPLTVEAWVRPNELSGYRAILGKWQSTEYALFSDEGVPQLEMNLGGRYVIAAAKQKLSRDKWTHLAGVYDGEKLELYVDGKLAAEETAQGKRRTSDLPLYIGADADRSGQPVRAFSGWIDEVRLTRSAAYDEEFQPQRRLAPTDDTVLLLHFDRRVGPFVLSEGSAAHGQLGPQSSLVEVGE